MYDLVKAGESTFYMDGPYNIGIYKIKENAVCLIDTGINDHTVQKLDELLIGLGWIPAVIINTHYHADHAGGNMYFQKKYGSIIYATKTDTALLNNFELCPSFIFGGYAPLELNNKYVIADNSRVEEINKKVIPRGLDYFHIDGHAPEMICVKTSDDVYFVADGVVSEETLRIHHVSYLYDVKKYLHSLDILEKLKGKLFIPSHVKPVKDIAPLVRLNRKKVYEICGVITEICRKPKMSDEVITEVLEHYDLKTGLYQFTVNGTIIRSYISYLVDSGRLEAVEIGKKLCWRTV